jgi:putative transposase
MARKPRNIVADFPFHVAVRGNNRQPVFHDDQDREDYRTVLQAACADHGLTVHGFVLLPSEVHLIATPSRPESLALVMQAVGRRYVRRFNRRHLRTGTLWEGRYRASVIQQDRYLLPSLRFLELEPVRAGLVEAPEGYPWSSHRHHLGLNLDPLVSPHASYWALGNTPFEREVAYRQQFHATPAGDEAAISEALTRGHPVAEPAFLDRLEAQTGRQWLVRPVGRPRRSSTV